MKYMKEFTIKLTKISPYYYPNCPSYDVPYGHGTVYCDYNNKPNI